MKKCKGCRFYVPDPDGTNFYRGKCWSSNIQARVSKDFVDSSGRTDINPARTACDKEGDGKFVYFEPKTPAAGAIFGKQAMSMVAASGTSRSDG